MATVRNASTRNNLDVQVIHGRNGTFETFTLQPGQTHTLALVPNSPMFPNAPPDTGIGRYSFRRTNTAEGFFWSGSLRFKDDVDVNPDTTDANKPPVTIARTKLKPADLSDFKQHFVNDQTIDPRIQNVTFDDLVNYAVTRDHWGNWAQPVPNQRQARGLPGVTDCSKAVAVFLLDCVLVIWGAIGLRVKISPGSIEDVAAAIQPELSRFEELVYTFLPEKNPNATFTDKAKAAFNLLLLAKNGMAWEAVYHALIKDLTWWDMVLYGVLAMAELSAAVLTDGAALIAEMAVELATTAFMVTDGARVLEACKSNNAPAQ
jgi:hypothetical protein